MAFHKMTHIAVCAVGLAAVSAAEIAAQPPANEPAVAAPRNAQLDLAVPLLFDAVDNASAADSLATTLSLIAATYGNQLGVEVSDLDPALRAQLGIEEGTGVVVTGVNKESEAEKAGLESYDVVIGIGEQRIAGTKSFHDAVGASPPEKAVEFRIVRKGKPATIRVTIPNRPLYEVVNPNAGHLRLSRVLLAEPHTANALRTRSAIRFLVDASASQELKTEQHYRIGVTLSEADDTLRSQLRLAVGEGLVVTEIVPDSAAAKAGIQKNDVLVKLDGKRLTTAEAVNAQIQEIKDRAVTIALFRGGSEVSIEIAPRLVSEPSQTHLEIRDLNNLIRLHEYERNYRAALDSVAKRHSESAAAPAVTEQFTVVKKQLTDLQKAVEMLEAAVQATTPTTAPAEEKKSDEKK